LYRLLEIGIAHQSLIIHPGDSGPGWKGEVENQDLDIECGGDKYENQRHGAWLP
jgi:hypothetical protein